MDSRESSQGEGNGNLLQYSNTAPEFELSSCVILAPKHDPSSGRTLAPGCKLNSCDKCAIEVGFSNS